jgi:hypothetical protein
MEKTTEELISEIEKIRGRNNTAWMDLVRLAFRENPEEAKRISKEITSNDEAILEVSKVLAGKKPGAPVKDMILIPGGGALHTYAVHEALALGLRPIVTDRDPGCPCAKIEGVKFVARDCYDVREGLYLADLHKDSLLAAFCGGADTHYVVANVMRRIGNPNWVSVEASEKCFNKQKMKDALLSAGVPTAKIAMRAPYVFKPLRGCGSRGVYRKMEGPLPEESGIAEELLEGPEQSVEILIDPMSHSSAIPAWRINIVDRHFAWVPDGKGGETPLEFGHTNPSTLDSKTRSDLYEITTRAANAVGAKIGFFKCDTILTKEGPKVLECTPRLSGGWDSQLSTPLSTGRNLLRHGIQIACGMATGADISLALKGFRESHSVTVIHRPQLCTRERLEGLLAERT